MKKSITIDQLRPGMYLIGIDQSWWNSPFILHQRKIKSYQEIIKLKQSGVKRVEIDPSKGLDVEMLLDSGENVVCQSKEMNTSEVEKFNLNGAETSITTSVSSGDSLFHDQDHGKNSSQKDPQLMSYGNETAQAESVRESTIQAVEKIFEGVMTGIPLDYPLLQQTTDSVVRHITDHADSMSHCVLLHNLRAFDKHLYGHVVDVCALSIVLALELGWEEDELHDLAIGALLHDIGYVRLPGNLLRERQRGRQIDFALLNQHAEIGVALLKQCPDISPSVGKIVLEHHERLDGSGIPVGLTKSTVAAASHLVGLIDRFDSLTSHWGGTTKKSSALVLRELYAEAKSGQFDVYVVERMIRCFGIYPVGSFVELSTKERGLVTLLNPNELIKPVIKVISDEAGKLYPSPFLVDLADENVDFPRSIVALLDPDQEGLQVGKYFSLVEVPHC